MLEFFSKLPESPPTDARTTSSPQPD
jgi:hypothetical protein